jgi:hypothetical protein
MSGAGEASGGDDTADTAAWIRFEFARHVHAHLQDQIRFSDTKAGLAAAVAGVLFGAFRDVTRTSIMTIPPTTAAAAVGVLAAGLFALFSILTVLHAFRVIRPRMPPNFAGAFVHHRALERALDLLDGETAVYGRGDLVSWAEMSDRAVAEGGPAGYASSVRARSVPELTDQLSQHSVVLALIAGQKYQHVRLALNSLLLAAVSLIVLMASQLFVRG